MTNIQNPIPATIAAHLLRMGQALAISSIGGLLPATAKSLDFGMDQNRLPLFLFALGFLLGLPLAKLRFIPQKSQQLGMATCLGFVCAMSLWGASPSYPVYAAAFFFLGLMAAWQELCTNPLMAELYPKGMATALNLLHALYCLWAFLGPLGTRFWLEQGGQWRAVPLITVPIFALAFLLFLVAQKRGAESAPVENFSGLAAPSEKLLIPHLLILMVVIYSGASFTLNAWAPAVLHEKFKLTDAHTSSLIGGFYGLMLIGRLLWAWMSPRIGARFLLGVTSLLSAVCHAGVLVFSNTGGAIWSLWATGLFIGSIVPLALAIEGEKNPGLMRHITSFVFVGMGFGMLIFPPGAGWLASNFGLGVIFPISLGLNVLMALLAVYLVFPGKKVRP